jgi:hypothetical protein
MQKVVHSLKPRKIEKSRKKRGKLRLFIPLNGSVSQLTIDGKTKRYCPNKKMVKMGSQNSEKNQIKKPKLKPDQPKIFEARPKNKIKSTLTIRSLPP